MMTHFMHAMTKLIGVATGYLLLISCSGRLALGPQMPEYPQEVTLDVPLTQMWKRQFMAGVADSPVFMGETVLVPLLNGDVMALSVRDGTRLATRKFTRGSVTGLALSGSTLYLALNPERTSVQAYDLVRGKTVWKEKVDSPAGAPAVEMERLFVTGPDGLSCLNRTDGSTLWEVKERHKAAASPASASGFVITNDRDGVVSCRQSESGVLTWKRDLRPEKLYSRPVICGDRVFITTLAGRVHALNLREGTPLWIWNQDEPIYAPVACDSTSLYVPAATGKIYRLSKTDGGVEWTFDTGELVNLELAVSDNQVVAVTNRGDVIVLSKESGREIWRTRVQGRIIIPPVLHDHLLLIADDRKWIYAFGSAREE